MQSRKNHETWSSLFLLRPIFHFHRIVIIHKWWTLNAFCACLFVFISSICYYFFIMHIFQLYMFTHQENKRLCQLQIIKCTISLKIWVYISLWANVYYFRIVCFMHVNGLWPHLHLKVHSMYVTIKTCFHFWFTIIVSKSTWNLWKINTLARTNKVLSKHT